MNNNPRPAGMESNRHEFQSSREQEEWARARGGIPRHGMGSVPSVEQGGGCYPGSYWYGPYLAPMPSYGAVYMGMQPMYMPMMGMGAQYFAPGGGGDSGHDQYEAKPSDLSCSGASRRTRMARRRMQHSDTNSECSDSPRPPSAMVQPDHKYIPAAARPLTVKREIATSTNPPLNSAGQVLMFLLAKQLSPSGVSSLGRIVLPKREAEAHLPHLVASEGVLLTMTDFDTRQSWMFRYRFWSNNKSRMYLLENTRDFVKAHNLQERDTLVLYKDSDGSYVVRGEKHDASQTSPHEAPTIEEEISRKQQTLEFLI